MLRLESNARAIDHNVIAQSSTNNGGVGFHNLEYASFATKRQIAYLSRLYHLRKNKVIGRNRKPIIAVINRLPMVKHAAANLAVSIPNRKIGIEQVIVMIAGNQASTA